jgi:hypothetical protein
MPTTIRCFFGTALVFLALASSGCGRGAQGLFLPNRPPEIEITRTALEPSNTVAHFYRVYWKGQDPDGRVDHYLYAVDPPSVDSLVGTWQETRSTEWVVSAAPVPGAPRMPHVFAVRAVDDRGAVSRTAWVSYAEDNLPPVVEVVQPHPSTVFTAVVPPAVTITWHGFDPDGIATTQPVKYKFRLFTAHNPDFPQIPNFIAFALQNPDSLRKLYAPTFAGWDSTPGDTNETRYTNLITNQDYLFVITGFDEAGDYDPVFSGNKNMLHMAVVDPCTIGPTLCLFGDNFDFCYSTSSCANDPARYVTVEMAADQEVRIGWRGVPIQGSDIKAYRWVLDPANLEDEAPRSDELTDWYHWSAWSLSTTEAVVGPFPTYETKRQSHLLFVQVEDTNGLRSLGIVHFILLPPTFTEGLLFVNDTRLFPDMVSNGVLEPPRGPWPTAAELDTFLFARGGFPWKGYPTGMLSSPGIFNGYDFDTLGTRRLTTGIVPLSTLSSYRTVVWFVDDIGASYTGNPGDPLQPISVLRHITSPGQADVLATYMRQGGRLWLMGGGAAYATLAAWNRRNTAPDEFTNLDGELVAGRFMYDFAHWRSALMSRPAEYALLNVPDFSPPYPNPAPGRNWSGQGIHRDLSMPDYDKLRDASAGVPYLAPRTCTTDPPPPLRDCNSFFVNSYYGAEFMGTLSAAGENYVREDANPDPDVVDEQSTLDTLYFTAGGVAPFGRPVMTYYHGFESPQLVFSGFPLWQFQRTQVTRLAQFVLTDIFQLPRTPSAAPARVAAPVAISTQNRLLRPRPRP